MILLTLYTPSVTDSNFGHLLVRQGSARQNVSSWSSCSNRQNMKPNTWHCSTFWQLQEFRIDRYSFSDKTILKQDERRIFFWLSSLVLCGHYSLLDRLGITGNIVSSVLWCLQHRMQGSSCNGHVEQSLTYAYHEPPLSYRNPRPVMFLAVREVYYSR